MTPARRRIKQTARFWKRVERTADACWTWHGALSADGYGRAWWGGRDDQAHRVAYRLEVGEIPPNAVLLHSCDNRACVNPAHLRPGTIAENNRDMIAKGRHARGTGTNTAKLNEDQIFAIRVLFAAGEATRYELAARFGVTHRQICYIVPALIAELEVLRQVLERCAAASCLDDRCEGDCAQSIAAKALEAVEASR